MNVKRKAVLIAAPNAYFNGSWVNPIPGVSNDISVWEDFLEGPLGGCWVPGDEIVVANKFTKDDLLSQIKSFGKLDYILFIYSGHGYSDGSSDYIFLSRGQESCSVDSVRQAIKSVSNNATLIIDACRSVEPCARDNTFAMNSVITKNHHLDESFQDSIRDNWNDRYIKSKKMGIVTIQSCQRGEVSYMIEGNQFSLFSYALFQTINDYRIVTSSVGQAFDAAKEITSKEAASWRPSKSQNPDCDNQSVDYPFSLGRYIATSTFVANRLDE